jgi:hypothetical protein
MLMLVSGKLRTFSIGQRLLYLQPMKLASEYHPWVCAAAVDNTFYLDAYTGLWKVEDFL